MGAYFWPSFIVMAIAIASLLVQALGLRRVRRLRDLPADPLPSMPRLSVVVSALDEAHTIEPALRSLLAADYPDLEVIAINDRSTDGTGAILDRLAAEDARLKVLHIASLPAGWLGKNHALHQGAALATGRYLLFTDADVLFERRALRQAVRCCEDEGLDHLVVMAEFIARSHLLAALLVNAYWFLYTVHPPWRIRHSRTDYIGMGAFNMVRAEAYRQAGGHEALRLEVIDDMALGKLMKRRGFRQDVVLGIESVTLEWYQDVTGFARGLEKNSYASFDYRLERLVAGALFAIAGGVWPWVGLAITTGAVRWMNAASIVAVVLGAWVVIRTTRFSRQALWFAPIAAVVSTVILCRGVFLTLRRGGIRWRGTLYQLDELKRAHMP